MCVDINFTNVAIYYLEGGRSIEPIAADIRPG